MNNISQNIQNTVKMVKNTIKPGFLLVIILIFSFPNITQSKTLEKQANIGPIPEFSLKSHYLGPNLPEIPARDPRRIITIVVTAYNSEPGQTDSTPFITAFNTRVRDGIIATNFLPKGTIVRFPDVFGEKEFVVEDRMNKRYYYRADIWMASKQEAVNFGAKALKMEIL